MWTGQEPRELPQLQALPEGPDSQERSWPPREGLGVPQLGPPGQGPRDRPWQQKEQLGPVVRLGHQGLGPVGQQQDAQGTSQLAAEGSGVTRELWGQLGRWVERWHRPGPGTGLELELGERLEQKPVAWKQEFQETLGLWEVGVILGSGDTLPWWEQAANWETLVGEMPEGDGMGEVGEGMGLFQRQGKGLGLLQRQGEELGLLHKRGAGPGVQLPQRQQWEQLSWER